MKSFAKLTIVLTALLASAMPAAAETEALPKPVADMQCLLGWWHGSGSILARKEQHSIDATWKCTRTSAGFGVLCAFRATGIPGVAVFDETDLMGYEPNTRTYHGFAVTNDGDTHDHVARIANGNEFRFVFTGLHEGQPYEASVGDTTWTRRAICRVPYRDLHASVAEIVRRH